MLRPRRPFADTHTHMHSPSPRFSLLRTCREVAVPCEGRGTQSQALYIDTHAHTLSTTSLVSVSNHRDAYTHSLASISFETLQGSCVFCEHGINEGDEGVTVCSGGKCADKAVHNACAGIGPAPPGTMVCSVKKLSPPDIRLPYTSAPILFRSGFLCFIGRGRFDNDLRWKTS